MTEIQPVVRNETNTRSEPSDTDSSFAHRWKHGVITYADAIHVLSQDLTTRYEHTFTFVPIHRNPNPFFDYERCHDRMIRALHDADDAGWREVGSVYVNRPYISGYIVFGIPPKDYIQNIDDAWNDFGGEG